MITSQGCLLLILASLLHLVPPTVGVYEEMLVSNLFFGDSTSADLRKIVRPPGEEADSSVKVTLGYQKLTIDSVDESNGYITLSAWEHQSWVDSRLIWDPSLYHNISKVVVPPALLWTPDITYYTTRDEMSMVSKDNHPEHGVRVAVNHSGSVVYIPKRTITFQCDFDVTEFPKDRQNCVLELGSWVHHTGELNFSILSTTIEHGKPHSEWKLMNSSLTSKETYFPCCPNSYETIFLNVEIQRKELFYYFIFIVPSHVITIILPLLHLFPSGCSQKTTLAGLLLVCSMILHLMLYQQLGSFTSDRPPRLIKQYDTQMVMIIVSVAISSITASIANVRHTSQRLPLPMRQFMNSVVARICCFGSADVKWRLAGHTGRHLETIRFNPVTDTSPIAHDSTDDENKRTDSHRSLDALIDELRHVREGRQLEREYYQLALLVDRLTAIVFTIYALVYVFVINPV